MSDAEVYVDEWLAHEPGMELTMLFVPAPERRRVALWGTLQRALDHAAFELSEPALAEAKLGWWAQELAAGAAGAARHPLAREWFAQPEARRLDAAQWAGLAQHALGAAQDERTPADVDAALARYRSYAAALAAVESAMFGAPSAPESLAIECLVRRLMGAGPKREWPLRLLAKHQVAREAIDESTSRSLRRDLAAELLPRLPEAASAPVHRRMRQALDAWRLAQWQRGREGVAPAPLARLWLSWRAARGA